MFRVNNKGTRTTQCHRLVSLLLTLNIFHTFFSASFINFEQVFFYWFVLGAFIINLVHLELLTRKIIISFPVSRTHLL